MLMPPYACTIPKIQYKEELGQGTAISETPEMERVKRNQEAISTVHCGVTPSFTLLPVGVPPKMPPDFNQNSASILRNLKSNTNIHFNIYHLISSYNFNVSLS